MISCTRKNKIFCNIKSNKQLGAKKIQYEKQEINKLQRICMNLRSFKIVETQKMNPFLILRYFYEICLKYLELSVLQMHANVSAKLKMF